MRLRLFGRLRDAVGSGELDVQPPAEVRNSDVFQAWIGRDHPALLDPSVRMVIGDRILVESEPLGDAEEIAFLPPVSGG